MLNLPNLLTVSRFALTAVFMLFLYGKGPLCRAAALLCFALACLTDYLDGRYARRHQQITFLGQILDPIADKVLMFAAFLSFVEMEILPAWMVFLMLTREVFVTAFRFAAASRGVALPAEKQGKRKTVLQASAIIGVLLVLIAAESQWWDASWASPALLAIRAVMLFVMAFTLWSGVVYAAKYWQEAGGAAAR